MPDSVRVPVRFEMAMVVPAGRLTLETKETVKMLYSGSEAVLSLEDCVIEALVTAADKVQTLSR